MCKLTFKPWVRVFNGGWILTQFFYFLFQCWQLAHFWNKNTTAMLPKPFCNCNLDAFESVVTSTHRSICIYTWTNLYIQISLDFGSIQCQPFSLLREKGNLGWINGQSETEKSNASGSIPYLLKRVLFSHNTAPHSLSTAHLIGCNKKSEIGDIFRVDCAIR